MKKIIVLVKIDFPKIKKKLPSAQLIHQIYYFARRDPASLTTTTRTYFCEDHLDVRPDNT